jgi:hypothetical protein
MRVAVLPVVLFALMACASSPPSRPEPEEPFPVPAIDWAPLHVACVKAEIAPRIDGRLDDAVWARAPWTEDFVDIRGGDRPAPRFRTRAKLAWDDRYLYVAAELEEPDLRATFTKRDSYIYREDADFEVFLDPDGDTHLYFELEMNALGTEWDLLLVKPYRDGGPPIHAWDCPGLRTAVALDGTLNDPSDRDRAWTVEIAFPWSGLADAAGRECPPKVGDVWRANLTRVEWRLETVDGRYRRAIDPETGEPFPEDNWVWSPQGLVAMHYPEMWGFVIFVEEAEEARGFDPGPVERAKVGSSAPRLPAARSPGRRRAPTRRAPRRWGSR